VILLADSSKNKLEEKRIQAIIAIERGKSLTVGKSDHLKLLSLARDLHEIIVAAWELIFPILTIYQVLRYEGKFAFWLMADLCWHIATLLWLYF